MVVVVVVVTGGATVVVVVGGGVVAGGEVVVVVVVGAGSGSASGPEVTVVVVPGSSTATSDGWSPGVSGWLRKSNRAYATRLKARDTNSAMRTRLFLPRDVESASVGPARATVSLQTLREKLFQF